MIQNPLFFSCVSPVISDITYDILAFERMPHTREDSVIIFRNRHNGSQSSKKARKNNFLLQKTKKTMLCYIQVISYIVISDFFGIFWMGGYPLNVRMSMVISDITGCGGGENVDF